jgi:hypothetical protein
VYVLVFFWGSTYCEELLERALLRARVSHCVGLSRLFSCP